VQTSQPLEPISISFLRQKKENYLWAYFPFYCFRSTIHPSDPFLKEQISDSAIIQPLSSGLVFGTSYVLNMLSLPIYNGDIYGVRFTASVLAATTFCRFTISSAFPLFTQHMIDKFGGTNGDGLKLAMLLLAGITIAIIPIPWIFWRWGPKLRVRSTYLKGEM